MNQAATQQQNTEAPTIKSILFDIGIQEDSFLNTVTSVWKGYGNVLPNTIVEEWRSIFNLAMKVLRSNQLCQTPKAYVHCGQMGLGKSTAANVLMAMAGVHDIGATLIVERKDQVDEAVRMVNDLAEALGRIVQPVACGKHTGESCRKVLPQQLREHPILITTHAGYQTALAKMQEGNRSKLQTLTRWKNGTRDLTIIDESFDPVDSYELTADSLSVLLGYLQHAVGGPHRLPKEAQLLLELLDLAKDFDRVIQEGLDSLNTTRRFREIASMHDTHLATVDALRGIFTPQLKAHLAQSHRISGRQISRQIEGPLSSLSRMLTRESYLSKQRNNAARFNSATWLLPDEVGSVLMLDGTATHDRSYRYQKAHIAKASKVRTFRGVTLHLAHRSRCGADRFKTKAVASRHVQDVYSSLTEALHPSRRVLVVTHLEGERAFLDHHHRVRYFDQFEVTHWGGGAVGSNDWREFDTVVIASQFFRPQHWASNIIGASQGTLAAIEALQEVAASRDTGGIHDLITGRLIADTLQAIFRIRLRKVVNVDGSSMPCDVFVLLPRLHGSREDHVLRGEKMREAIIGELPGAKVKDWELAKPKEGRPVNDLDIYRKEEVVWDWMIRQDQPFSKADLVEQFPFIKTDWLNTWRPRLANRVGHSFKRKVDDHFTCQVTGRGPGTRVIWTPKRDSVSECVSS